MESGKHHSINGELLERQVSVAVAGVGGNGAQVIGLLARLNLAILALGHPFGIRVTAYEI